MLYALRQKLQKSYRKNAPDMAALRRRLYPEFVFSDRMRTIRDEIPVFTFHSVNAEMFEAYLRYLSENNYRTVSAEQMYEGITGRAKIEERSIVLTFDDCRGSVWAIAYPLLKKYAMKAVCFVVPGFIEEGSICRPNLDDVWGGKTAMSEIEACEKAENPFCTWAEIRKMDESGVIDFQSHTLEHVRIAVSNEIIDFMNPAYDLDFYNLNIPAAGLTWQENRVRRAEWGMPIYRNQPRMSGKRRYFPDNGVEKACIDYVQKYGRDAFFKRQGWKKELYAVVEQYHRKHSDNGYYETTEEQRKTMLTELKTAKEMIEKYLPHKQARHLCYPWFDGSELSVLLSVQAGYVTNFWGTLPGRRTNRAGDDPLRIVRIPYEDYIYRLPGGGRISLLKTLKNRYAQGTKSFIGRFSQRGIYHG